MVTPGSIGDRLRIVGWLLLAALAVWIAVSVSQGMGIRSSRRLLKFGSGAEGSLRTPIEEVNAAFDATEAYMIAANDRGRVFAALRRIAAWLSLAVTASITLMAGFHGRRADGNRDHSTTPPMPQRTVRIISLLAALAAVLTGFSSLASSESKREYERADRIFSLASETRADLATADSLSAESEVLTRLRLDSGR